MKYTRFKWVDIFTIIFGIITVLAVINSPAPKSLDYVPDAVKGLTSLGGVLVGFIGFCLTYFYSNVGDMMIRKWLQGRLIFVVLFIGVGLVFIMNSYHDMVLYDNLAGSYKTILIGIVIIIALFLNTTILLAVEEE